MPEQRCTRCRGGTSGQACGAGMRGPVPVGQTGGRGFVGLLRSGAPLLPAHPQLVQARPSQPPALHPQLRCVVAGQRAGLDLPLRDGGDHLRLRLVGGGARDPTGLGGVGSHARDMGPALPAPPDGRACIACGGGRRGRVRRRAASSPPPQPFALPEDPQRHVRRGRGPEAQARRHPPHRGALAGRASPGDPSDPRRWLGHRGQAGAGPAAATPAGEQRLGGLQRQLPAQPRRDVARPPGRLQAGPGVDPRARRRVRRGPRVRRGDRWLGRRTPHGDGGSHLAGRDPRPRLRGLPTSRCRRRCRSTACTTSPTGSGRSRRACAASCSSRW